MSRLQASADPAEQRRRAALCAEIRAFFAERGVMEVQTPVLSHYAVTDVHIESWRTQDPVRYLRTSPEFAMKKLLAAGSGDIYELGPVFRHGEQGEWHSPEFTMLEWYRVGWTYHELVHEVVSLLQTVADGALADCPVNAMTYREATQKLAGMDPLAASTTDLQRAAREAGLSRAEGLGHSQLLDFLFTHAVQPCFEDDRIHVIRDFPESQAALARIEDATQPPVAQRFEVFIGPIELANGYQELTDPTAQAARFTRDNATRGERDQPRMPIDSELLQALEKGLPECSGVSVGLDRLLRLVARPR